MTYAIDPKSKAAFAGLAPYRVTVPPALAGDRPTVYRAFTRTRSEAIKAVEDRRTPKSSSDWTVVRDYFPTELTLCPLCGERMMVAIEESEPGCEWAHCSNPACFGVKNSHKGLGFSLIIASQQVADYYEDEGPSLSFMDGLCDTCGKHGMVMNTSVSSPNCVNPECKAYLALDEAGLDEDDFTMSCVDPAEWGILFCDECSAALVDEDEAHVDLHDEDGSFNETRTLCPECREGLDHDPEGNANDPRNGMTQAEVLEAGGTVGVIVGTDASTSTHSDIPTYHATIALDGSPGGVTLSLGFAEKLPFKVEVIGLTIVERERIDESDENEMVTIPVYKPCVKHDPYGEWYWDGDSIADVTDGEDFSAEAWRQHDAARKYIAKEEQA